jgi:WD40 repeat protein/serine/threonine protein kinase
MPEPQEPVVRCPDCGLEYSGAPRSLCPRCLLSGFTESPDEGDRRFGDYVLEGEPKAGGMGVVYRARQISLHRTVALKLIKSGQLASREDIQRFQTEAEAAALLDHPHIVPIYDIGEHEGRHFFTMRFVEGRSLAEAIRERMIGLPSLPETAPRASVYQHQLAIAGLMADITEAVAHAHQRGVLHRDLKPDNVLLDAQGRPHLTDFGLAKLLAHESGHTQTRALLGSPCYMSPEQAVGDKRKVTTASDLYSLGAILYELLVGLPPHPGTSVPDILRRVVEEEPRRPHQLRPFVDADLETICLKCLNKDPARRYASAADLAEDLRRFREGRPIAARPPGTWRRLRDWTRRHPALAALMVVGTLALALASALVWQQQFTRLAGERARFASLLSTNTGHLLRIQNAEAKLGSRHPERQLVTLSQVLRETPANVARKEFPAGWIAVQRLLGILGSRNHLSPRWEPISHLTDVNMVAFSPNGAFLATAPVDSKARLWDRKTGRLLRSDFAHDGSNQGVAFSPDSTQLLTWSEDQTARAWSLLDSNRVVTFRGHNSPVDFACFSPDGTVVLTLARDAVLRAWDAATGQEMTRTQASASVAAVEFIRDGRMVALATRDGVVRFWDPRSGQDVEPPWNVGRPIGFAAFSPDSRSVAVGFEGQLLVAPIAGSRAEPRVLQAPEHILLNGAKWDPSSRYLAAGGGDFRNGSPSAAFLWDSHSGVLCAGPLRHPERVGVVRFSPHGLILATGSDDGTVRVWEVPTGRELAYPAAHAAHINALEFSADGTDLVTGAADFAAAVWSMSLGRPTPMLIRRASPVRTLDFQTGSDLMLTAGDDDTVRLIDLTSGQTVGPVLTHPAPVYTAWFTARSNVVFTSARDGKFRLWDLGTGRMLDEADSGGERMPPPPLSWDRTTLATRDAVSGRDVKVWSVVPRLMAQPALSHPAAVPQSQVGPGGATLVTACFDGMLRIWDLSTRNAVPIDVSVEEQPLVQLPKEALELSARFRPTMQSDPWPADASASFVLTNLAKHRGHVSAAMFLLQAEETESADSATPSGFRQDTLAMMDPLLKRGTIPWLYGCQWSPDGTYVVTASFSGTASAWRVNPRDAADHSRTCTLSHRSPVLASAFSPDSTRHLTGCQDGTAYVWELPSGRTQIEPITHDSPVTHVGWSQDGLRFFTVVGNRTVRIWDSATGLPASDSLHHPAHLTAIRFTPDGRRLVTASTDSFIRVWDAFAPAELPPRWMAFMVDALAHTSTSENTERNLLPIDLHRIKAQRLVQSGSGFYAQWARWFFDDSPTNTVSVLSHQTRDDAVRSLIAENREWSLRAALEMQPANALALARLAAVIASPEIQNQKQNRTNGLVEWKHLLRLAHRLAPSDPEVQRIRSKLESSNVPDSSGPVR